MAVIEQVIPVDHELIELKVVMYRLSYLPDLLMGRQLRHDLMQLLVGNIPEDKVDEVILGTCELFNNIVIHVADSRLIQVFLALSSVHCTVELSHDGSSVDIDWLEAARADYRGRLMDPVWGLVRIKCDQTLGAGVGIMLLDKFFKPENVTVAPKSTRFTLVL